MTKLIDNCAVWISTSSWLPLFCKLSLLLSSIPSTHHILRVGSGNLRAQLTTGVPIADLVVLGTVDGEDKGGLVVRTGIDVSDETGGTAHPVDHVTSSGEGNGTEKGAMIGTGNRNEGVDERSQRGTQILPGVDTRSSQNSLNIFVISTGKCLAFREMGDPIE